MQTSKAQKSKIERLAAESDKHGLRYIYACVDHKNNTVVVDSNLSSTDLGVVLNAICDDKAALIALGVQVGQMIKNLSITK